MIHWYPWQQIKNHSSVPVAADKKQLVGTRGIVDKDTMAIDKKNNEEDSPVAVAKKDHLLTPVAADTVAADKITKKMICQ
jgi:hypothetical protein